MGKTTPKYSSGVVNVNGEEKASHYKKGNTVYSNYNMSDAEKKIYDFAQNSFLENLPNVNVFSEDTQKNMQNQLGAYTQKGLDTIQDLYNPMLSNLKTDIASRFGNFDNSVFLDNLNSIESKRSDAMNSLTQDLLSKQNELVNDELSKRYNYLNFLNSVQNQTTSNIMDYLNQASENSSAGTSYNFNAAKYGGNLNPYANLSSSLGRALGLFGASNPYTAGASSALKLGSLFL